jgi:hypothetical protein
MGAQTQVVKSFNRKVRNEIAKFATKFFLCVLCVLCVLCATFAAFAVKVFALRPLRPARFKIFKADGGRILTP